MLIFCISAILYYNPSTDFGEKSSRVAWSYRGTDEKRVREKDRWNRDKDGRRGGAGVAWACLED